MSNRKRSASWEMDSDDFTCSVCLGKKILRPKFVNRLPKKGSVLELLVGTGRCGKYLEVYEGHIISTKCGHNFCEKCLVNVRGVRKRWPCPQCRQIHVCTIDTLSRNYLVEKFVEKFKKQAKQPKPEPNNLFGNCEKHKRALEVRKSLSDFDIVPLRF